MRSVIETGINKIIIDGATIRISNNSTNFGENSQGYKVGIVSILPKVQIALGGLLDTFIDALEVSRLPLALKKTVAKGEYSTYDIVRLETGNIKEATIATLSVYSGIIIGLTYSRSILLDKEFRKLVRLSAMHQLAICNRGDKSRLLKATQCISTLTGIPRNKLMAIETARSIRVKVPFTNKLGLPLYYTFSLDKSDKYNLLQVSFDFNEVAKQFKNKGE